MQAEELGAMEYTSPYREESRDDRKPYSPPARHTRRSVFALLQDDPENDPAVRLTASEYSGPWRFSFYNWHRRLANRTPQRATPGRYNARKKLISKVFPTLFYLNMRRAGSATMLSTWHHNLA